MRLLVIDPDGSNGLDLCIRAQEHGHEVKLAIRSEKNRLVGNGFVEVVRDPRDWFRWSNLIVATDNNVYIRDLDQHRQDGGLVVAANQETAQWEINRQLGQAVLRKAGIPTIPAKQFTDYDAAIRHVKKEMKRYVSKPTGDGTTDKALSYVSNGPDDMVYMLERWKKLGKLKTPFILQEFIPGVEMGVAGWFGPGGWSSGWEENFEFKKLMNDDLGPATGEQGTVMRIVSSSKLASKVLKPLTDILAKAGYIGDIDVNCIIDEKGQPWPLEFTTRLGWPAFNLQLALLGSEADPVSFLYQLATGQDHQGMTHDQICCGIVLTIPDYPYSHLTRKEVCGIPIYGALKQSLWRHIHPCEMQLCQAPIQVNGQIINMPQPATAGDYVLTMTAIAPTVRDAALTCYRRLDKLKVPNSPMYRTDIGKKLAKDLPKIQSYGYAMGMRYSLND
jgi:phosphoribosylamine--glycine ligase